LTFEINVNETIKAATGSLRNAGCCSELRDMLWIPQRSQQNCGLVQWIEIHNPYSQLYRQQLTIREPAPGRMDSRQWSPCLARSLTNGHPSGY